MKKITAFFLLLLPIFVTGLMFISGLIQKWNFPVAVAGISISETDQDIIWDEDKPEERNPTFTFHAHVIPFNAKNQDIKWESSNTDIAEVNDEGKVTLKDYGRVMITATALGNENCVASREIDSFDTIVHTANVSNSYDLNYLSPNSIAKPTLQTRPSIDHVGKVDGIEYTISPADKGVSVDKNSGLVTVDENADTANPFTLTTTVKTSRLDSNEDKKVTTDTTINIGPAVDALEWSESNTDETVSGTAKCNLFDKITFGPATKQEGKITASDFTYECDNEDVAKVDKNGNVTFSSLHQDEYATFTVTYRRNPDLKVSKKIKCSNIDIKQIFFNQSHIEMPMTSGYLSSGKYYIPRTDDQAKQGEVKHPENVLKWTTYPESASSQMPNITIESTNNDVVSVEDEFGGKMLQIVAPGKCALKISANDSENNPVYSDVCEVTILTCDLTKAEKPIKDSNVTAQSAYYFLRDNIKCAKSSIDPEEIRFELNSVTGGSATIDDNNILHFASKGDSACVASVTAYVGQDTIGVPFTVSYKPDQIKVFQVPTDSEPLVLNAGDLVKFSNGTPIIEDKYYEKYFDVVKDESGVIEYFIPKQGCDIPDFMIESKADPIRVIVTEDPIYVASEQGPLYSTPDTEVDFLDTINPKVFPSSATKSDGSIYEPIYGYAKGDGWKVDENIINFSKVATCEVNVKFGEINDTGVNAKYYVRSTFNDEVGKFKVTKDDSYLPSYRTVMRQYDIWDAKETLRIDNIHHSLASKISIESTTGLCNPTITDTGGLFGYIEIKANPISGKFGTDVIKISSPTYSLFLNLEIKATITDFAVTCQQDVWGTQAVNTYVDNLKVRVTANTINKDNVTKLWSWSLNDSGTKTEVKDELSSHITLSGLVEGQNILHLYNENSEEVKQYIINYKKSQPNISLYGAEDGIYASCNSSTKSALIVADGYVANDFFKSFIDKSSVSEGLDKAFNDNGNVVTITNIDQNTNGSFTLSNGTITKTYPVGRDQVSKIKLTGHNSLDQSDKKGMQKVHVYGNKSYYNEPDPEYPGYGTEGLVNYYKVPVVLYDQHRSIIGKELDTQGRHDEANKARVDALRNLKITFGNAHSSYQIDPTGKFINIYFDSHDLYSPQEIYNNAFDSKSSKNINFQVATKSNEVHADYTFVTVDGTNAWSQEVFGEWGKYDGQSTVLQKNFGVLDKKTKENAVLDKNNIYDLFKLYGNGYCLDTKTAVKNKITQLGSSFNSAVCVCLNIDIHGADDELLQSRKQAIKLNGDGENYNDDNYIGYSIIHNFMIGMDLSGVDRKVNIKNTIFYNILDESLALNSMRSKKNCDLYLENSSFINSGSFTLYALGPNPIHIKGDISVYNFRDREMLRHIDGSIDLTSLWPLVLQFARRNNMIHRDYKNDEVVNSFACTALDPETYFWDYSQNTWIKTTRGIAGSGKYLSKYADISIPLPIIGRIGGDLWGGANPSVEPGAPQYSDEFDNEGKLKMSLVNNEIKKLSRVIKYF